jgi:hypothetical protein
MSSASLLAFLSDSDCPTTVDSQLAPLLCTALTTLNTVDRVIQLLHTENRVRITLRLAVYRQSVRLGDKPLETHDQNFYFPTEHLRLWSLYNILSDERMGLLFTIAAVPRQRSRSQVRVPRYSWPYFTVSDLRLSQHGGPDLCIYIP